MSFFDRVLCACLSPLSWIGILGFCAWLLASYPLEIARTIFELDYEANYGGQHIEQALSEAMQAVPTDRTCRGDHTDSSPLVNFSVHDWQYLRGGFLEEPDDCNPNFVTTTKAK